MEPSHDSVVITLPFFGADKFTFFEGYDMKKLTILLTVLACIILFNSYAALAHGDHSHNAAHDEQMTIRVDAAQNPWTSLHLNNDPDNFHFIIVSDNTGGSRPGVFPSAVEKINLLQPEFVMSIGDLIQGYTEDLDTLKDEWDEFDSFVDKLEMPFFYLSGNHDYTNPVMAEYWEQRYGKSYYHFVYRDVLFLCLNTQYEKVFDFGEEQIQWAQKVLDENPDVRWTLIFMHSPRFTTDDPLWARLEKKLSQRKHTAYAGHYHTYNVHRRNNTKYFVLATTGGGSELKGPSFGQFDHVVWITMTDDGPIMANLLLEGIHGENIREESLGKLIRAALAGGAITSQPIYTTPIVKDTLQTTLRLTNDADIPIHITGKITQNPDLIMKPQLLDITIPPNSVELINLKLQPARDISVENLPPVEFNWNAVYQIGEVDPFEVTGRVRIGINTRFEIPRSTVPVAIDGKLDDWPELPVVMTKPADAGFRFAVSYDDENLYIAAKVDDDDIISASEVEPWDQDGIEVRLDLRKDPDRSQGRARDVSVDHLLFALSPGKNAPATFFWSDRLPKGAQGTCVKTKDGYITEISVPISYIESLQSQPWRAVRINFIINDYDMIDGEKKLHRHLFWRPDWRCENNFIGSGTFFRK